MDTLDAQKLGEAFKAMFLLPFGLLLAFTVVFLISLIFWWCAVLDCLVNEGTQDNHKIAWILVMIATGFFGAFFYFFIRRPQRRRFQDDGVASAPETYTPKTEVGSLYSPEKPLK